LVYFSAKFDIFRCMVDLSTSFTGNSAPILMRTLAQLTRDGEWQLDLMHDRPVNLFIWITRGQGLALLDGARRGVGTHNALFVPAGTTMAIELGRQSSGQVIVIPDATELRLPSQAHHLRIRDVSAQSEISVILEGLQREQTGGRPLVSEAVEAHTSLLSIWLRRQLGLDENMPSRPNAATRLCREFCRRVSTDFRSGAPMAEYAQALGVTPTHLTRVCRASTGKTAADLLTQRILYDARHLLGTEKAQIQDVARYLGFGSAAYFTRFMHHHTGQSPSALRKAAVKRKAPALPALARV
jgi:AraC family transcriptional activator of pobA